MRSRFEDAPDIDILPDNYLDRDCPVCGSPDKTHLSVRKIESPTTKGWYIFQHHDVRCDVCNFHYSTNIPEPSYINDYYKYAIAHAGVDYNAKNRIEVIERLVPKDLCVLEYGSGQGEFAGLLCEAGYRADGVDICDDIPKIFYDAICCYYTLEHLVFPNNALKMFRGLLGEKGVLIVEVPDFERHPKASVHFQHLNHFTKSHLRWMLANNGFECIETIDAHSRGFGFAIISAVST